MYDGISTKPDLPGHLLIYSSGPRSSFTTWATTKNRGVFPLKPMTRTPLNFHSPYLPLPASFTFLFVVSFHSVSVSSPAANAFDTSTGLKTHLVAASFSFPGPQHFLRRKMRHSLGLDHGGHCSVGRVGHGPPKILVRWATMHLAQPIICLYVR